MAAIQELVGEIRVDSSGVKRGVDDANQGLGKLESSAVSAGESMKSVGRTATMGLTAPIVAGMGAAAKSAADFETQMTEVEKVTDPATANRMGEAIKNMAAEMPVAHKELATIAETAGRLGVSSEHLEGFTRNVAKMAAATDLTAEEAADSFARISTLMEYPIEKSEELGSAMNELSNSFGTSTSEITDVMTRAGGAFNALGLGTDQALGLAAAMNEVSPSSRLAAGGLKRISEMLMDPKKVNKIADAFGMTSQELQKMIKNDPSGVIEMLAKEMQTGSDVSQQLRSDLGKQASELTTLGSNWEAVEGATSMANEQLKEGTSLQKEFDAASSTLNSQLQITKNQFRNVGIALGEALLPYLSTFNDILQGVAKRLMNMSSAQRSVLLGVAALVAAIGPLLFVFGTILTMVPSMVAGWGAITAALSGGLIPALAGAASTITGALAPALSVLLGPIGIAIGAIALLAAAWATDFGGIRKQTMRVVGVLQEELAPAIEWIRGVATAILNQFGGSGSSAFSSLSQAAAPLIKLIADGLIVAIRGLAAVMRVFVAGATAAWNALGPVITSVLAVIQAAIGEFMAWFGPIWTETMGPIMDEAAKTWSVWSQIVTYTLTTIRENINAFLTWLAPYWNAYWAEFNAQFKVFVGEMRQIWAIVGDDIIATAQFVWDLVASVVRGGLTLISGILRTIAAIMRADWATAWNIIHQTVVDVVSGIGAFVMEWGYRFVYRIGEIVLGVIDWFVRLGQELIWGSIVPDIFNAIQDFIVSKLNAVGSTISSWVGTVVGYFTDLKDGAVGQAQRLKSQFISVMGNLKARVQKQVRSLVDNIVGIVRAGVSRFKRAGRALISAFADGISDKIGSVKTSVKDAVGAARRYLPGSDADEGPLSDISQTGPALVDTFADGIESERGRVEHAARTIAEAARNELNTEATMQLGVEAAQGTGEKTAETAETGTTAAGSGTTGVQKAIPTLDDLNKKYGESSPGAMEEALSYLNDAEIHQLADELKNTKWIEGDMWSDGFENAKALIEDAIKNGISQNLYDALITQGGGYHELDEILRMKNEGPKTGKVQAEDGSWVDPSYYNRTSKPAAKMDSGSKPNQQTDRSEPLIDFSNLPDDAYVSVDALKSEMEQVAKKREHDVIKSATDGDFTF